MKTNVLRILFVGVEAALCFSSADAASCKKQKEVVATKPAKKAVAKCGPAAKGQKNLDKSAEDAPSPGKFYWPKKSAARKVLEG